jgi:hypothetical protein
MLDDSTINTTHWKQPYSIRFLASEQAHFDNDQLSHIPNEQVGQPENALFSSSFEV